MALVVQVVIAARVPGTPHSVTTGLLRGSSLPGRIIRVFSFFTIQSNVLSGMVSAQLAIRPDRDGPGWRALRLAALTGITVTGIVYSAVLADVHEPHGAAETMVNTIVHYVVPIMMVAGWLLFGPRPRVDRATVLQRAAVPAALDRLHRRSRRGLAVVPVPVRRRDGARLRRRRAATGCSCSSCWRS